MSDADLAAQLRSLGLDTEVASKVARAAEEKLCKLDKSALNTELKDIGVSAIGTRQKVIQVLSNLQLGQEGNACGPDGCALGSKANVEDTTACGPEGCLPPPPSKSVLRVRCGAVELKLTLGARLLGKSFQSSVVEPFLAALNKKQAVTGAFPIELDDVAGALVEGSRVAAAELADRSVADLLGACEAAHVEILVPDAKAPQAKAVVPSSPLPRPPTMTSELHEPVKTAASLREVTGNPDGLRAHLSVLSPKDLKDLFPRHGLVLPAGAVSRDDLIASLVATPQRALEIEIISDVGKRKLELAMAKFPLVNFHVLWRPFELVPSSGQGRRMHKVDAYMSFMGDMRRVQDYFQRLRSEGAKTGIAFEFDGQTSSTLDAHRLTEWALRTYGPDVQDQLVEAQFSRYMEHGEPPNSVDSQVAAAASMGLDADAARKVIENPQAFAQETTDKLQQNRRDGVSAVPNFRIGGREVASGAQPVEYWESLLRRIVLSQKPMDLP